MNSRIKGLGLLIPVAVSISLLLLVYRKIDPGSLVDGFRSANLFWASLYILLSTVEPVFRGIRWSLLVPPASKGTTVRGLYIAKAGNNLLPLRMGDAIRAQFIRDRAGVPYSRAAASILAESVLDLLFLGAIVLLFGIFMASKKGILLASALLVALPLLGFLAVKTAGHLPLRVRRSRPVLAVSKVVGHLRRISEGRNRIALLASTAVLWILTLFTSYCGLMIFLPEVTVLGVLATIVFVYFSVLVPSAPGFIGTYHAAIAGSLALMGYELSGYPAAPIAIHLFQFIPQTAIGLILGVRYLFSNDWTKAWDGLRAARDRFFQGGDTP
jgi:glycosyltransferase 2 family protein